METTARKSRAAVVTTALLACLRAIVVFTARALLVGAHKNIDNRITETSLVD